MRLSKIVSAAAFAAAAMLAIPAETASAFMISGVSASQSAASARMQEIFYRGYGGRRVGGFHGGYGYHRGYGVRRGYGYRPYAGAAAVGGLAVGAAVLARHCWINSYGVRVCN